MANEWEDRGRYGSGRYGYERDRGAGRGERDWSDRAGDEMRSWFGDDDAERRRVEDERRDARSGYGRERGGWRGDDYGYGGGYASRGGRGGGYGQSERDWNRPSYGGSDYDYGSPRWSGTERYGVAGYGMGLTDYPSQRNRTYGGYRSDRDEERGFLDRAGDEVASWFGDEDAARRRDMDAGHRGRGPKNYSRSDDRIREDVNDRLSDDPHIDASHIDVSVSSGEVTLDGTVDERFAKRHAEDIAERVSGVKHVQNNLRIKQQDALGQGRTGEGTSSYGSTADAATGSATRR